MYLLAQYLIYPTKNLSENQSTYLPIQPKGEKEKKGQNNPPFSPNEKGKEGN
jgi:hypothetical protein